MTEPSESSKPIIGLMGGPGSGKSTVARCFAELGCAVIDADKLAHDALLQGDVMAEVRQRWGGEVFGDSGAIDRKKLGGVVFADTDALRALEAIVHPRVHAGRQRERDLQRADAGVVAIVEDCPLLLESELADQCDVLVFVEVPEALRLKRVAESRGWDAAELRKRDKSQLPLDTKRREADYVIRNDRDLDHTREQVRSVLHRITHTAAD
jgi:dephospho-CoA kinase